jgi:polyisoprenoid-binding protein YceI
MSRGGHRVRILATCAALLLASCRTVPPAAVPGVPARVPVAPVATSVLYTIDAEASRILVLVYREGPMAALGHNHVMSLRELTGSVQAFDDAQRSRFDLSLPVAAISVDEPGLRAAAGADFASKVSDAARTGTRNNMLGDRLLQAAGFARITLQSENIVESGAGRLLATTRINVRGQDYRVDIPLQLERTDDELTASGEFKLRQSALGLTPFSVMMGALRVQDEMMVQFRLVAHRVRLQ